MNILKDMLTEGSEVLDKRCPFCGSYATIKKIVDNDVQYHWDEWIIKCKKCPAQMKLAADSFMDRTYYTREEAIKFWNQRV